MICKQMLCYSEAGQVETMKSSSDVPGQPLVTTVQEAKTKVRIYGKNKRMENAKQNDKMHWQESGVAKRGDVRVCFLFCRNMGGAKKQNPYEFWTN